MIENILHDPGKWRRPLPLTPTEKNIIRYLIECETQDEVARKCCMSKRKLEAMISRMKMLHGCATTIQLVVKINADFRTETVAA